MKQKRLFLIIGLIAIILGVTIYYYFFTPRVVDMFNNVTLGNKASTPYGERLSIKLGVNGKATQGSWMGSVSGGASNLLYDVSGTVNDASFSDVADAEKITITFDLSVSGSYITNVQIVSFYLKVKDKDGTGTKTFTIIGSATSITIPYNNTYTALNNYAISTLISDVSGNTNNDELLFLVYIKVTATGSKSGQTLTAEINEEQFADLTFTHLTEQNQATVSPSVSVSSWIDMAENIVTNVVSAVVSAYIIIYYIRRRRK